MSSQARRWCFTLNNPSFQDGLFDLDAGWEAARYAIYQSERGEAGTPHHQGYVEFKSPKRLSWCRKLIPGAHWEPARGTQEENTAYCSKQEGRVGGPWTMGQPSSSGQGARSDLLAIQEAIDGGMLESTLAREHFSSWCRYRQSFAAYRGLLAQQREWAMDVLVICGPPGTGKSRLAREIVDPSESYWWPGGGEWFDGYSGQRAIVLDEFRGGLSWSFLLRLLDRYPLQVQVKGGFREMQARVVIITSNKRPEDWYDREKFFVDFGALARRITMFLYLDKVEEYCIFQKEYTAAFYIVLSAWTTVPWPYSLLTQAWVPL